MKNKGFKICAIAAASVILLLVVSRLLMGTQQKHLPLQLPYLTEQLEVKERPDQKQFSALKIIKRDRALATEYTVQQDTVTEHTEGSNHTATNAVVSANKKREEKPIWTFIQKEIGWKMVNRKSQTQIFSAYIDDRDKQLNVIILGLQDHTQAQSLQYYCVLKYPNETEVCLTEPAIQTVINGGDEKKGKTLWAYSFTCKMDREMDNHLIIGLSTNTTCSSNETTWLPISKKLSDKGDLMPFGVCIETPVFRVNHREIPVELVIEGIERNRALGAEWITVYVQDTSEDIIKVLKDYEKEGVLEIVYWNLPKEAIEHSHYYAESVSIADCLYRNMYRVKYLAFVDLDEIIVPQNHSNWTDMIIAIDKTNIASFLFEHTATHPKQLQGEFIKNWTCPVKDSERWITQHTLPIYLRNSYRTPPYSSLKGLVHASRRKTIIKPSLVKTMGIHRGNSFLNSSYQILVQPEIGLLYHYRTPPLCQDCIKFLKEDHRIQDLVPKLYDSIRERLCQYKDAFV